MLRSIRTTTVYDSLPSNGVEAHAPGDDGTLYVGAFGKGIAEFDGVDWVTDRFENSGDVNVENVRDLAIRNDGNLYATVNTDLASYDGVTWSQVSVNDGTSLEVLDSYDDAVFPALATNSEGTLLLVRDQLFTLHLGQWTAFGLGMSLEDASSIVVEENGCGFIAVYGMGVVESEVSYESGVRAL